MVIRVRVAAGAYVWLSALLFLTSLWMPSTTGRYGLYRARNDFLRHRLGGV